MPDKDWVITIITHILFNTEREIKKNNAETSVDLTLKNHYIQSRAGNNYIMLYKITSNALQ